MIKKLTSRKLQLTLLFTFLGFILVLMDKLSADMYMGVLAANYGLYYGANVLQKTNPIINHQNGLENRKVG